jgi:LDH2 family malate/lactate/ureidoglycolate dehydrogenase
MEGELKVDAGQLLALCRAIFESCGMSEDDAHLLADSLVDADLSGVHSHGVLRVPEYVKKLTEAGVDPAGRPEVVKDEGACLVVDGHNAMGQIGAAFAMHQVIARAKHLGMAAAAVRGSNHCGAMGYFARMPLAHDMIGIATTNALPTMAPWGGAERILGINPLGFAIPAGREVPLIYDAAFSGTAHGKIRVYFQKGLTLPEGWAADKNGVPTTDAAEALEGLLLPIGAFKGVSLAMIMGIMSSMLSGASYGTELGDMESGPKAGEDGHFVAAIRVSAFEDVRLFKDRVDRAIRQIHSSRRAPGVERLYVPGEPEAERRALYGREGIPLNSVTLADIRDTAKAQGVSVSRYAWLGEEAPPC